MIIKCKMCGGDLEFVYGSTYGTCEYCGSTSTIPNAEDETKLNRYNRANHLRCLCEFDKAIAVYEKLLEQDDTDAEAHWGAVLSRYGIEYVEDPATKKRIPTCHRAQMTSILTDADYKAAIDNAPDVVSRQLYEEQATQIAEIQKSILAVSAVEKPYDVFICYKETDEYGQRTHDSQWAQEIFYILTEQGYKVFFSRITLEDKLGQQYEPYIFAALNSAKVMVVIGSKPEYFNAVWVKNEWSRFLSLMAKDKRRVLIPCYRGMDPYDLPEELSMLQSQDMSKIGFVQDLTRGICKILGNKMPLQQHIEQPLQQSSVKAGVEALLKRGFLFLEDANWNSADEYFERVLDADPENAYAYVGKLMIEQHVQQRAALSECNDLLETSGHYQKAMRFADAILTKELTEAVRGIKYRKACEMLNGAGTDLQKLAETVAAFRCLEGYKDSDVLAQKCEDRLSSIYDNEYNLASSYEANGDNARAAIAFGKLESYRDSKERSRVLWERTAVRRPISAHDLATMGINEDGTVCCAPEGDFEYAFENIVSCQAGEEMSLGLVADGTVIMINACEYGPERWYYPVVSSVNGYLLVERDGSLKPIPYREGLHNVADWKDIVDIVADYVNVAILKIDGTVMLSHYDKGVSKMAWSNIIAIVNANGEFLSGLKADGTVVTTSPHLCNEVSEWTDIVSIASGPYFISGLKSDGTVVLAVDEEWDAEIYGDRCELLRVSEWRNIISISAEHGTIVGLKNDGTVVAAGSNTDGECNVDNWTDIIFISTSGYHTVGLKSDGTVVAVGCNTSGQCATSEWKLQTGPSLERFKTSAYRLARRMMESAKSPEDFESAANSFHLLSGYKDSETLAAECVARRKESLYQKIGLDAQRATTIDDYMRIGRAFESIKDYKDAEALALQYINKAKDKEKELKYQYASRLMENATKKEEFLTAAKAFNELNQYKAAVAMAEKCTVLGTKAGYRMQGLCEFCGGEIKGLFKKKCSVCGKLKNY